MKPAKIREMFERFHHALSGTLWMDPWYFLVATTFARPCARSHGYPTARVRT